MKANTDTIKVKFKCVSYEGKAKTKTTSYECPKFEEIPVDLGGQIPELIGLDIPPISVESQQMTWLDEQDKSEFMEANDIHTIFDYSIVQPKEAKEPEPVTTAVQAFRKYGVNAEILADFTAVYFEMEQSISHLTQDEQLHIVMKAMSVAYTSSASTLDKLADGDKKREEEREVAKIERAAIQKKWYKETYESPEP